MINQIWGGRQALGTLLGNNPTVSGYGRLEIVWHEPEVLRIELTNPYDVRIREMRRRRLHHPEGHGHAQGRLHPGRRRRDLSRRHGRQCERQVDRQGVRKGVLIDLEFDCSSYRSRQPSAR